MHHSTFLSHTQCDMCLIDPNVHHHHCLHEDILKRAVGYRYFCNKIWNAFKFSQPFFGGYTPCSAQCKKGYVCVLCECELSVVFSLSQLTGKESTMDKWIMSRLSVLADDANKGFVEYDFPLLTTAIYNFWLYELCNVYMYIVSAACVPSLCLYMYSFAPYMSVFLCIPFAHICIPLPTICACLYSFCPPLHMSVFLLPTLAHVCIPFAHPCTCLYSFCPPLHMSVFLLPTLCTCPCLHTTLLHSSLKSSVSLLLRNASNLSCEALMNKCT